MIIAIPTFLLSHLSLVLWFTGRTDHYVLTMAKRGADDGVGGEPPPKKVQFEQIKIGPVSTLEEIDMKTLHFQNKKLAEVRG